MSASPVSAEAAEQTTGSFLLAKVKNMFCRLDSPATNAELKGLHAAHLNERMNEVTATHLAQAIADLLPSSWRAEEAPSKLIEALAADASLPADAKATACAVLQLVQDSTEASLLLHRYCMLFEEVLASPKFLK